MKVEVKLKNLLKVKSITIEAYRKWQREDCLAQSAWFRDNPAPDINTLKYANWLSESTHKLLDGFCDLTEEARLGMLLEPYIGLEDCIGTETLPIEEDLFKSYLLLRKQIKEEV